MRVICYNSSAQDVMPHKIKSAAYTVYMYMYYTVYMYVHVMVVFVTDSRA